MTTRCLFACVGGVVAAMCFTASATAQTQDEPVEAPPAPFLTVTFDETEAIPGQPLSLRIKVLTPTYMPSPPVWPSLDAPNLLVRLPERSTNPVSEPIDGETWAGVSRHYRVSPMVPGEYTIPPQNIVVTYADPDTNTPTRVTLTTDPLAFSGVVPQGAEGLDPFIAANALTLSQDLEGGPIGMAPGDSISRSVTAKVEGVSPMFLPTLLPAPQIEGLAAYPDEPSVEEKDERGIQSGTRHERITYVAQGGTTAALPHVSLDWYSLKTETIETATLDAIDISVDGPPARPVTARGDGRETAIVVAVGLVVLGFALLLGRWILPPLRRAVSAAWAHHLASEAHAYGQLQRVIRRQDHAALRAALDTWAARVTAFDVRGDAKVQAALTALGASKYSASPPPNAEAAWTNLGAALAHCRRAVTRAKSTPALPPLNPGAA